MGHTLLLMSDEKRRPRPAAQYGATAAAVAANVERLRKARGMTIYSLSGALSKAGRPITPSAIAKIEKRQRQVTVDDLTALADVLDVSPVALLLPRMPDEPVSITPAKAVPWQAAWRWALGEQPAFTPDGDDDPRDARDWPERRRRFIAENQPHRNPDILRELAQYVRARLDGPFHVELDSAGPDDEYGTLSLRSEGQRKSMRWTEDVAAGTTLEELAAQIAHAERISLDDARERVRDRLDQGESRDRGEGR